jgi:hypothetical protein
MHKLTEEIECNVNLSPGLRECIQLTKDRINAAFARCTKVKVTMKTQTAETQVNENFKEQEPQNAIEEMELRRRSPDYEPPCDDLGYCKCGTVWRIDVIAEQGFPRGTCPECGELAAAVEWRRQERSLTTVDWR